MSSPTSVRHYWFAGILVGCLCAWSFYRHFHDTPNPNLLTWDNYGYYLYLPGALSYGDLKHFDFAESHFQSYEMQGGLYQLQTTGFGRVPIYTIGMAYLYAPFYLVAKGIANLGAWPDDGMSAPFQVLMLIGPFILLFLGLLALRKVLAYYVDEWMVVAICILVVFGTNYFYYLTESNASPHAWLFSLYALLLYFTEKWYRESKARFFMAMAAVIFLLVLARPSELVAICIPLFYGFPKSIALNWRRLKENPYIIPITGLIGLVMAMPQMLIWYQTTGQWLYNPYTEAGHNFHFAQPHILEGLFSYRKGWLLYTPLMGFAIAGIFMVRRYAKVWTWAIPVFLLINTYIVFSWHMWWYASSFGSRPMVHSYPLLAIPLACLAQGLKDRFPRVVMVFALVIAAWFVFLNQFQIWQYVSKILPGDGINKTFYWDQFLVADPKPDAYKYLDLPGVLPDIYQDAKKHVIRERLIEEPRDAATPERFVKVEKKSAERIAPGEEYSRGISLILDAAAVDTLRGRWSWIAMELYREGDAFDAYNIARCVVSVRRDGSVIDEAAVRFPFFLRDKGWKTLGFEWPLPETLQAGDEIVVFVWNPSPDTIYVHRSAIEVFEKK